MPKFKLVFSEEKTQVRCIEVEVEVDAEDPTQAAQALVALYEKGKYDTELEEAVNDSVECRNEVAYHNDKGEYVVLLPWK
jgi:hypothetical protein